LRALSLGVPAFSSRSAFSSSLAARSRFAAWASRYSRRIRAARDSRAAGAREGPASRLRAPAYRRPSVSLKREGRKILRKRQNLAGPNSRLPSLMPRILVRWALFVVITLSLALSAGCGPSGDPRQQANGTIIEANQVIEEHNRLYAEARDTYDEAKEAVETGDDPSEEAERFTETRETMEEAQARLSEARQLLAEVRNLDVDTELRDYVGLLSEALDTQAAAEDREIDYYRILEEDPSLEDDRERALNILQQVDDFSQRAEEDYDRAREFADDNPELIRER
jgi:hypothetical protein